ncbi:MAG TPA: hypothetical protein VFS39_00930 [Nitrospira sp.]|nr:hypothetical protein [Nitrospira sp.]
MISSFDLTLLGSLVTAGGLAFLGQGKRPWAGRSPSELTADPLTLGDRRQRFERTTSVTGARWLTVGALTLFAAYAHGAEEGYLFGPWSDVMFHLVFVSSAWGMTAFRIKQTAGRSEQRPSD